MCVVNFCGVWLVSLKLLKKIGHLRYWVCTANFNSSRMNRGYTDRKPNRLFIHYIVYSGKILM